MSKTQPINEQQHCTQYIILLQALTAAPESIAQILESVAEASPGSLSRPAMWFLIDRLNHLLEVEERHRRLLQRVIQEEHPLLPQIWPDEKGHDLQAYLEELAARFHTARAETLALLKECSVPDWQRQAHHKTLGETNLGFLVQTLVNHDAVHIHQFLEYVETA